MLYSLVLVFYVLLSNLPPAAGMDVPEPTPRLSVAQQTWSQTYDSSSHPKSNVASYLDAFVRKNKSPGLGVNIDNFGSAWESSFYYAFETGMKFEEPEHMDPHAFMTVLSSILLFAINDMSISQKSDKANHTFLHYARDSYNSNNPSPLELQFRLYCLGYYLFFVEANKSGKLNDLTNPNLFVEVAKQIKNQQVGIFENTPFEIKALEKGMQIFSSAITHPMQPSYKNIPEFSIDFIHKYLPGSHDLIMSPEDRKKWWAAFAKNPESQTNTVVSFTSGGFGDKAAHKLKKDDIELDPIHVAPIIASDNEPIHYDMYVPSDFYKDPQKPRPVIFKVYGGGKSIPFEYNLRADSMARLLATFGCIVVVLRDINSPEIEDVGASNIRINYKNFPTRLFDDIEEVYKTLALERSPKGGYDQGQIYSHPYIQKGKTKTFLMGGSFGGYVSILMATTPEGSPSLNELFDGYISWNGVYDWKLDEEHKKYYDQSNPLEILDNYDFERTKKQKFRQAGGYFKKNYLKDDTYNEQISPLYHLDQLKRPILLMHGAKDLRVVPWQIVDFMNAAKKAQKEDLVTTQVFRNMGHDINILKSQTKEEECEIILNFIAKVIDQDSEINRNRLSFTEAEQKSKIRQTIRKGVQGFREKQAKELIQSEHPYLLKVRTSLMTTLRDDGLFHLKDPRRQKRHIAAANILQKNREGKPIEAKDWIEYFDVLGVKTMGTFIDWAVAGEGLKLQDQSNHNHFYSFRDNRVLIGNLQDVLYTNYTKGVAKHLDGLIIDQSLMALKGFFEFKAHPDRYLKRLNSLVVSLNKLYPLHKIDTQPLPSGVSYRPVKPGYLFLTDEEGETILHKACSRELLPIVQYLVGKGADVNRENNSKQTPLQLLLKKWPDNDVLAILELLLADGAKLELTTDTGRIHKVGSIIMAQSKLEQTSEGMIRVEKIIKQLVRVGDNVNHPDKYGVTPLHVAAMNDNLALVKLLLSLKADPNARDQDGKTPLDYAKDGLEHAENKDDVRQIIEILSKETTIASGKK